MYPQLAPDNEINPLQRLFRQATSFSLLSGAGLLSHSCLKTKSLTFLAKRQATWECLLAGILLTASVTPLPGPGRWLCVIQSPGFCLFGESLLFVTMYCYYAATRGGCQHKCHNSHDRKFFISSLITCAVMQRISCRRLRRDGTGHGSRK